MWADIHDALRDQARAAAGRNPAPTAAVLDSQTARSAEGGEQIGWDQAKKTRGRKRHLLVDTAGLLLICHVHSAAVNDRTGAKLVLGWPDEQYPGIKLVAGRRLRKRGGRPPDRLGRTRDRPSRLQIVTRSDDVKGFQVLPRRWVVERVRREALIDRVGVRDHHLRPVAAG